MTTLQLSLQFSGHNLVASVFHAFYRTLWKTKSTPLSEMLSVKGIKYFCISPHFINALVSLLRKLGYFPLTQEQKEI